MIYFKGVSAFTYVQIINYTTFWDTFGIQVVAKRTKLEMKKEYSKNLVLRGETMENGDQCVTVLF